MRTPALILCAALVWGAATASTAVETRTLTGRVLALDGSPIADAWVVWVRPSDEPGVETRTDRNGAWSLDGLPVTPVPRIEVSKEGYHLHREIAPPGKMDVVLLKRSAIRGTVASLNSDIKPGNVRLVLYRETAQGKTERLAQGEAATDGSFAFEGLESGRVVLETSAKEFKTLKVPFKLGDDAAEAGLLELDPGARLMGVVLCAKERTPIPGAKVRLAPVQSGRQFQRDMPWMLRTEAETTTDDRGRFMFAGIGSGDKKLIVEHPTRPPVYAVKVLVPDMVYDMGEIAVPPASKLSGRVRFRNNDPLPGCTVTLLPAGPEPDIARMVRGLAQHMRNALFNSPRKFVPPEHTARTDAEGYYRFERLPAGDFEIGVGDDTPLATRKVTLVAGYEARLDFNVQATRVHGRIREGDTPVARTNVELQSIEPGEVFDGAALYTDPNEGILHREYMARSDDAGEFDVLVESPKTYLFKLSPAPSFKIVRKVDVEDAPAQEVDFDLLESSVLGRVVTAGAEKPVEGVTIALRASDPPDSVRRMGRFEFEAVTDADGMVVMGTPKPGTFEASLGLLVQVAQSWAEIAVPEMRNDEPITLTIDAPALTPVVVSAITADGAVPEAFEASMYAGGNWFRRTTAPHETTLAWTVPRGVSAVVVNAFGYGIGVADLDVGADPIRIAVLVQPGGFVNVTVTGGSYGVRAGGLDLASGLQSVGLFTLNPGGRVQFQLPPGSYSVSGGKSSAAITVVGGQEQTVSFDSN